MFTSTENYRLIMWGIPIVTILHNMEEAIFLSNFIDKYNLLMPELSINLIGEVTVGSMLFVLLITAILPVLFVWWSDIEQEVNTSEILLYCFAFAMFINIIPHSIITFFAGSYSPGMASSILLVLPATLFLFMAAIWRKRLNPAQWAAVMIGGLLFHGPGLFTILAIGNTFWG
jgi:drug/metabolite transporter (DMT)-like permease